MSFAAGGLVGGVSTANFASPNSKKARLADMFLLGKDLKGTKAKFDFAVSKNKISRTDADELLNQIKALQKARVPVWMLSNPEDVIKYSVLQQDVLNLQNSLKKFDEAAHPRIQAEIDTKLLEIDELVKTATETKIEDQVSLFNDTFKVETILLKNEDQLREAGFNSADFNSDGWLESDGRIFVNLETASKRQAVSVASHELLHKIIKSEFAKNPNITKVVEDFKNILQNKGVLE